METWGNPDTNRTAVTTLLKKTNSYGK